MFQIHGFKMSFNTKKVVYAAEEVGADYEYIDLDLTREEHKTPEHLARHPLAKTPTLVHDGRPLFESATISRYLCAVHDSPLYPMGDHYQRALVEQWMDFSQAHIGRWLGSLLFERFFKSKIGMGEPNEAAIAEALGFLSQQMGAVEEQLGKQNHLAGADISIADIFAYSYVETTPMSEFSLEPYPNIQRWLEAIAERPTIKAANAKLA